MSAPAVINTLQELAGKEVDQAAEKLGGINKQLEEELGKLEMLRGYRNDYLEKLSRQLSAGLDAQAHQNFQRFMRMLDQAIAGQEDAVQSARQQVQQCRELWQASQRKKLSYEVLGERSEKRAQQQELKRDQKLMDEHAMRARRAGQ